MAWKVEGSCFIQAGGKAVAGGLATGGVAARLAMILSALRLGLLNRIKHGYYEKTQS